MNAMQNVTILVAVLNKKDTIRDCIESLLELKTAPAKIMVVDGFSKDGTYEILKEYEGKIELYQYPKNLSATFNWALDKIETEYTVLTDGDCQVDPDWLGELMRGFAEEKVVATAGYCDSPPDLPLLPRLIGLELENRFKRLSKYLSRAPTMNLALKTQLAKKVRFDEKQTVGVETDFGWRLSKFGKIAYLPKARVFHYHRATLKEYFKQQKNQAKGGVRLLFKHKQRALGDQITGFGMSIQIPFLFFSLFFLLLALFFNNLFFYPSFFALLMLVFLYLKNIIEINPPASYCPAFFGLFFLRTFAWLIGIVEGLLSFKPD